LSTSAQVPFRGETERKMESKKFVFKCEFLTMF
jgi:hypothetical protein